MVEAGRVPQWFEPRLPAPGECSIAGRLLDRCMDEPEADFAAFENGVTWTNAAMAKEARALAGAFEALGVKAGDVVAIWQPNGPNMLRALFACSLLGVAAALMNVALRGNSLSHALGLSGARLLYGHGELLARVADEDIGAVTMFLSSEDFATTRSDVAVHVEGALQARPADAAPAETQAWDIAVIVYTSGTTGESKGVRVTAGQLWTLGRAHYGFMGVADRILLMLPLFHIASLGGLHGALSAGASVSVMESFRAADFFAVVRGTGATTAVGLNSAWMNMIVQATPSGPADRDHGFRICLVTSLDRVARGFAERFGCDLFAAYSMSETSGITVSGMNPAKDRCVGRLRDGLEGRLVDDRDIEVPLGQPGELIIRSDLPWVLNDGYFNNATATVKAWRNGWFHTGDTLRQDEDGDYYFVDRNKDVIRRRGENISSLELEAEIRAFAQVRDVAVVGVRDDEGNEDVLAAVEPQDPATFDPVALVEFLIPRVPHYMVPRYIRALPQLPRNATNKVLKVDVRGQGLTPDSWDREAAGVRVRRQKLSV